MESPPFYIHLFMIKFDTNAGSTYLNQKARVMSKYLLNDEFFSLKPKNCQNCSESFVVIGFEVDPILGVRPYVKKACCKEVENTVDERLKVKNLR